MTLRLVWLVLVLIVGAACTPLRPYRCDYHESTFDHLQGRCAPAFERTPDYALGYVEFDDVGAFWSRDQQADVMASVCERLAERPQILVAFVHGWNHNASRCDGNVSCFRRTLQFLGRVEAADAAASGRPARGVTGLYVGWRGAAYRQGGASGLYNWTSFWKRKGTAHEIGGAGGVADTLLGLERLLQQSNMVQELGQTAVCEGLRIAGGPPAAPPAGSGQPSRLVAVGHSFGGAVLFESVAHVLLARGTVDPEKARFGDLMVLVNPAFEASRVEVLRSHYVELAEDYANNPSPTLAIFTASSDDATGRLFPAGRWVGTWWERHRPGRYAWSAEDEEGYDQGKKVRTAVGHYEPYLSHDLERIGEPRDWNLSSEPDAEGCRCPYPIPTEEDLMAAAVEAERRRPPPGAPPTIDDTAAGTEIVLGDFLLVERPEKRAWPLMIVRTDDAAVLEDHSKIYNGDFIGILRSLVRLMDASEPNVDSMAAAE